MATDIPGSATILAVDDQPAILRLLVRQVQPHLPGVNVVTVGNPADALARVRELLPDVVLLDIKMPGMDGYEVCRQLKRDPTTCAIPVMLISGALRNAHERVQGLECGADGFLCKPYDVQELIAQIRALMRLRASQQQQRVQQEIRNLARFPSEDPSPVLRVRKDGVLLYANRGSMPVLAEWGCRSGQKLPELWHRRVETGLAENRTHTFEMACAERTYGLSVVPFPKEGYINIYGTDITERKDAEMVLRESNCRLEQALDELRKTQDKIIQQERLKALGQMVGGVAHDFNNALMPILGLSDFLISNERALKDEDEARTSLESIREAARGAREIVRRLREFYRPTESLAVAPLVVADLFDRIMELTEPAWKTQAEAEGRLIDLSADVPDGLMVPGNEAQLCEVLTNMVLNSVDAMPDGGRITLRARLCGDNVVFEVIDTGEGMTKEVLDRCVEPFFSTKGTRGSGLGLAVCHGVIKRHGGSLDVRSEVGKGTVFALSLPAHSAAPPPESAPPPECHPPVPWLRVLVIDDEAPTCRTLERLLRAQKHDPVCVNGGRAALACLGSEHFDLVITDKAMPDMRGEVVAREIKRQAPQLPVIMLTGFGDLMAAASDCPACVDEVLGKPVTGDELNTALQRVMCRGNPAGNTPEQSAGL